MKGKTTGLAFAVLAIAVLWFRGCGPAIYTAAGEYRLVGRDDIYLIVESSGRVTSNAFERAGEREYTWLETPDDREILIYPKNPSPKIRHALLVHLHGDDIVVRFDGEDFRFRKTK